MTGGPATPALAEMGSQLGFDGLIVDLDGVVWLGGAAIPHAVESLRALKARVPIVFVTNDPSGAPEYYVERLTRVGIEADREDVVTSGSAMAAVIREREGLEASTFVIGSVELKREFEHHGLDVVTGEDRTPDVVAVGGHLAFNYDELRIATLALRAGAKLYGAGRDATFPTSEGPLPATGAILAAVEVAGGVSATVVGKPEPHLFELARARLRGCNKVAVVGDNLHSDIAGGKRAGFETVLVLTGSSTTDDIATTGIHPALVVPDLRELAVHV